MDFWRKVRYSSVFHPNLPKYLTPHVLSEWMVEVCAGDKYRVRYQVRCFERYWCFVMVVGLCFVLVKGY